MRSYVPTWYLCCAWCDWYIAVGARGARGRDQGSGVEAADLMTRHVAEIHGRTWPEFLAEPRRDYPARP